MTASRRLVRLINGLPSILRPRLAPTPDLPALFSDSAGRWLFVGTTAKHPNRMPGKVSMVAAVSHSAHARHRELRGFRVFYRRHPSAAAGAMISQRMVAEDGSQDEATTLSEVDRTLQALAQELGLNIAVTASGASTTAPQDRRVADRPSRTSAFAWAEFPDLAAAVVERDGVTAVIAVYGEELQHVLDQLVGQVSPTVSIDGTVLLPSGA